MIQIIDNFLRNEDFHHFSNYYQNDALWLLDRNTVFEGDGKFQFIDPIFADTIWSKDPAVLDFFLDKFEFLTLYRIKVNLQTPESEVQEQAMHTDLPNDDDRFFTAIFYLNSNDGYTKFETGEKVESVANRLVVFPSNIKHAGSSSTDFRITLNMNAIAAKGATTILRNQND